MLSLLSCLVVYVEYYFILTVDNTELCCIVSRETFVDAYTQTMAANMSYHHFNNAICLEKRILLYIEWNGIGITDTEDSCCLKTRIIEICSF
jgi:hypothetical protein